MTHDIGKVSRVIGTPLRRLFGTQDHDSSGIAAVEFGLMAPLLALSIICTVDLGLGIYRKMQVQNAAQAGAEYAVTHGYLASAIATATTSATSFSAIKASPEPTRYCGCASGGGVVGAACGSTCPGGSSAGTYVTVSAQSTYTTLLPYPLLPGSFALTAQSTVRIQ